MEAGGRGNLRGWEGLGLVSPISPCASLLWISTAAVLLGTPDETEHRPIGDQDLEAADTVNDTALHLIDVLGHRGGGGVWVIAEHRIDESDMLSATTDKPFGHASKVEHSGLAAEITNDLGHLRIAGRARNPVVKFIVDEMMLAAIDGKIARLRPLHQHD